MSNDPAPGGEQPPRQGQQPYPGGYGQQGEQPAYPGSYPPPNQPGGYPQAPPPWAPQNAGQPVGQSASQRDVGWPRQYPGAGPQQQGPAGLGPGGVAPDNQAQSVSGALFDFGFNSFATPVVIKVLYILIMIAIGLGLLFGVVVAIVTFSQSLLGGLFILLGSAIGSLVALVYARVLLELNYAVVRIAEDVRVLRNRP